MLFRSPYLYPLPREKAVTHAFRVASGLDSMVLGEPQILGQMKDAVRSAEEAGTLGTLLNKLFQQTFSVAKAVRTQTEIGASSVSMAAAAVRLAERIYPSIERQAILFIGAGEMIELCAAHFCARKPRLATFANRTQARARALAERFGGRDAALADIPAVLSQHDIVVACTASPFPIVGKGLSESAVKARKHRPILMFDLAVPRDIEPEVATLDDIFLYTVDDLGRIAQEGMAARRNAVAQSETIIAHEVQEFLRWMEARGAVPTIRALRDDAERVRRHELERAVRLLAKGEDPRQVLEALSQGLTNKFLHAPTHALNNAVEHERETLASLLNRIYQIHPKE